MTDSALPPATFPLAAFLLTLLGNVFVLVLLTVAVVVTVGAAVIVFGSEMLGLA